MFSSFPRAFLTLLPIIGPSVALEKHDLRAVNAEYDYIVVGGGVSGLVVANRLSEDSKSRDTSVEAYRSPANEQ